MKSVMLHDLCLLIVDGVNKDATSLDKSDILHIFTVDGEPMLEGGL